MTTRPGSASTQALSPTRRYHKAWILTGVLTGLLLAALDQTAVATALPKIVEDLGGFSQFAWVFTAYMLASTTTIPIVGKLSDLYGRKATYLAGLAIFTVASILNGLSSTMTQLVLFRGLQGVGAGAIMANTFTVIADIFPPAERGKWQGIVGAVFGIASVVGPLVGGYLTDQLSWHWVFYINLPIGLVSAAILLLAMPSLGSGAGRRRIDYSGAGLLIAGVVPLLLAFHYVGQSYRWLEPHVLGLLGVAVVMLSLFVWNERRVPEPIQPPFLFANSIFVVSAVVVFLVAGTMFGAILFIPLYAQVTAGYSATDAGVVLMPLMLSMVMGATLGGQIISRMKSYRWLALCGLLMSTAGFYLLWRMGPDPSRVTLLENLSIVGAGMGTTFPVFMISVQNAFPHRILGVVTASIQFFRSMGGAVGSAVFGSFLAMRLHHHTARLLAETKSAGSDLANALSDPFTLLNSGGLSHFQHKPAELQSSTAMSDASLKILQQGFSSAMHEIFLLGMAILLVSLIVAFYLKEIPLRTTHEFREESESSAAPESAKLPH